MVKAPRAETFSAISAANNAGKYLDRVQYLEKAFESCLNPILNEPGLQNDCRGRLVNGVEDRLDVRRDRDGIERVRYLHDDFHGGRDRDRDRIRDAGKR